MPTLVKCQGELDYLFVDMTATKFWDSETVTSAVTLIWDWGLVDSGLCIDVPMIGIEVETEIGTSLFGRPINVIIDGIEICAGVGSPYLIRRDAQTWTTDIDPDQTWSITEDPEQVWTLNNRRCGK